MQMSGFVSLFLFFLNIFFCQTTLKMSTSTLKHEFNSS